MSKKLQVICFCTLSIDYSFPKWNGFWILWKGAHAYDSNLKLKTYIPHEMGELFMCMNLMS